MTPAPGLLKRDNCRVRLEGNVFCKKKDDATKAADIDTSTGSESIL